MVLMFVNDLNSIPSSFRIETRNQTFDIDKDNLKKELIDLIKKQLDRDKGNLNDLQKRISESESIISKLNSK